MGTEVLVVLDLETTGLDPYADDILEIGAILVDESAENSLLGPDFHALIRQTKPMAEIDPFVRQMHEKNGLWAALEKLDINHDNGENVDHALANWLIGHGAKPGNVVLIGYSIHFDHGFLKAQWPKTAALLSHRIRDVGAFLLQCREWGLPVPEKHAKMPHRALADAQLETVQYLELRDILQGLHADSTLFRGGSDQHSQGEISGVWPIP